MLPGYRHRVRGLSGKGQNGFTIMAICVHCIVKTLPWVKRGEMQAHYRRQENASNWGIPPTINLVLITRSGGGAEPLPGQGTAVLGDLNADIGRLKNPRYQQVAEIFVSFELVDLLGYFRQCICYCQLQTWWQVLQSQVLRSSCDYVLALDQQMFKLQASATHCHGGYL